MPVTTPTTKSVLLRPWGSLRGAAESPHNSGSAGPLLDNGPSVPHHIAHPDPGLPGPRASGTLGTVQHLSDCAIRTTYIRVAEVLHAILSFHPRVRGGRRHRLRAFPARAASARPPAAGRGPRSAACCSPGGCAGTAAARQGTGCAACQYLLRIR